MTDWDYTSQNLPILDNLPPVVSNGHGEYGSINIDSLVLAADLAGRAFRTAEEVEAAPDTLESLRESVNLISDAVRALSGEMMQVAAGVRTGRLAATPRD